MQAIELLKDS